jgi:type IV pilus assembly protein PilY1
VLDATAATNKTGTLYAYIDLTQIRSDAGRVIADIIPVDVNNDGYTDVLYAVDTRGYVWRINVSDLASNGTGRSPSTWASHTYPLAMVSKWSESSQYRKLMYAPDVLVIGKTNIVLFGSGNREQPTASSSAVFSVRNRFHGVRDSYRTEPSAANQGSIMIDATDCDRSGDITLDTGCALLNVTTLGLDYSSAVLGGKGWIFSLSAGTGSAREQVVTTPTTIGGVTYFSTFKPSSDSENSGMCGGLGIGYGYAVNALTGGGTAGAASRAVAFTSPGIPPSPISGLVKVEDFIVPFVIGANPPSQPGSALEGHKPNIAIKQRRSNIYRYWGIDRK